MVIDFKHSNLLLPDLLRGSEIYHGS